MLIHIGAISFLFASTAAKTAKRKLYAQSREPLYVICSSIIRCLQGCYQNNTLMLPLGAVINSLDIAESVIHRCISIQFTL